MCKNLPAAIALTVLVACLSLVAGFCYALLLAYVTALVVSLLVANGMPLTTPILAGVVFALADTGYHLLYKKCLFDLLGRHATMALYAAFGAVFYLHARDMTETYPWFFDIAIVAMTMFCASLIGMTCILQKFSSTLEGALPAQ
jgi:hypothetical protein